MPQCSRVALMKIDPLNEKYLTFTASLIPSATYITFIGINPLSHHDPNTTSRRCAPKRYVCSIEVEAASEACVTPFSNHSHYRTPLSTMTINQETGEVINTGPGRSARFTLWIAFLVFSTVTLGSAVGVVSHFMARLVLVTPRHWQRRRSSSTTVS